MSDGTEDMCPNCVTPWKCNGPHVAIKPGDVCRIVDMQGEDARDNGLIVTVLEPGGAKHRDWRVDAPWMRHHPRLQVTMWNTIDAVNLVPVKVTVTDL